MQFLKKTFIHSPGHYIAALILAVMVGAFRFATLLEGIDDQLAWYETLAASGMEGIDPRFAWYEILSVSGYVTFLIGALLTVAYFGAFDLFSYAFTPNRTGKYRNYTDYSQKKAEKRARGNYYFVPYYVVGIAVVLISYLFS